MSKPADGDDYTYATALYHPEATRDLRTLDAKEDARIAALERRVDALESLILSGQNQAPDGSPPCPRAGVLIVRKPNGEVNAQHIMVRYAALLDAQAAIRALQSSSVAFVQAQAASTVLDALGVQP